MQYGVAGLDGCAPEHSVPVKVSGQPGRLSVAADPDGSSRKSSWFGPRRSSTPTACSACSGGCRHGPYSRWPSRCRLCSRRWSPLLWAADGRCGLPPRSRAGAAQRAARSLPEGAVLRASWPVAKCLVPGDQRWLEGLRGHGVASRRKRHSRHSCVRSDRDAEEVTGWESLNHDRSGSGCLSMGLAR